MLAFTGKYGTDDLNLNKYTHTISEVLMYADFHRKSATKEKLVNTMCGFFTDVEIKRGKSLLYDRFGAQNIL